MTDQEYMNFFGTPRPVAPVPPFGPCVEPYNAQNLASYAQARKMVTAINALKIQFPTGDPRPMGGGVLTGDDETPPEAGTLTGIYVPGWSNVPGAGPEGHAKGPDGTDYLTLCIRFENGKLGMNVGLILDKFSRFPMSPQYVIGQIAAEAEA